MSREVFGNLKASQLSQDLNVYFKNSSFVFKIS